MRSRKLYPHSNKRFCNRVHVLLPLLILLVYENLLDYRIFLILELPQKVVENIATLLQRWVL